jgi:hypothetical protein
VEAGAWHWWFACLRSVPGAHVADDVRLVVKTVTGSGQVAGRGVRRLARDLRGRALSVGMGVAFASWASGTAVRRERA